MSISATADRPKLDFDLPTYHGSALIHSVESHIDAGRVPYDTLFRLASIGANQIDATGGRELRLIWVVLNDINEHADNPTSMRAETHALLFGEPPDAVIDQVQTQVNRESYKQLDQMYYRLADFATVIKERRALRGKTVTEVPRRWDFTPDELETNWCYRLARPIWRTIIQKRHPEWLDRPEDYYTPTISFNEVYYAGEKLMRRRLVGAAVLGDALVSSFYSEAREIGIRGVGPEGKETLRQLLEEEHPELHHSNTPLSIGLN